MAEKARPVPLGCPLTRAEFSIIELLAEGLTHKQIALRRGTTPHTTRVQMFRAYRRLGVHDRAHAVIKCFKAGWLGPAPRDSGTYQARRLADATERLVLRLEEAPASRLRPYQQRYLDAVSVMTRARTDEQRAVARMAMDQALGPMLAQVGVDAGGRRKRDLVELLVSYIANAKHP